MKRTDCQPELLTLYHYDELQAEERQGLEVHLAACPACRKELEELESALRLAEGSRLQLSELERGQFTRRVRTAATTRRRAHLPAWGLALSGAAALAVTLIMLRPDTGPVPPQQPPRILAEMEILQDLDMLDDLELLEDLDLLQEMGELG